MKTVMSILAGTVSVDVEWQTASSNQDVSLSGFKVLVNGKQHGFLLHSNINRISLQVSSWLCIEMVLNNCFILWKIFQDITVFKWYWKIKPDILYSHQYYPTYQYGHSITTLTFRYVSLFLAFCVRSFRKVSWNLSVLFCLQNFKYRIHQRKGRSAR